MNNSTFFSDIESVYSRAMLRGDGANMLYTRVLPIVDELILAKRPHQSM